MQNVITNNDNNITRGESNDASDAGAQSGTVTFVDGSTLTFEGIETIIQDPDNTAPTANDDVTNTAEGAAVQVNVLANDTDPEGGDLDILGTPTAANGTVEVNNETGEITYTPNPGFVGTDTITYTIVDEGGLTDTATLTVNVAAQPDSGPDAIDDSITVFESESESESESEGAGDTDGNVLTNDLQEAGEPGPYTGGVVEVNGVTGNVGEWIDLPEGGRVLINSDGSVDFDANGDFEGLSDGESENVTIDYCIQTTSASSSGANPGEGPTINVGTTLTNLVTIGGTGAETFAVGGDGDLIGGTEISVTGNLLPPLFFGNDKDTLDISDAVAQGWTPTELIRLPDQPLIGNGFSGSFLLTKDGELPVTVTYLEIENFVGFDNVTEKDAATLTVTVQGEDDAPVIDPIDDTSIDENSTAPVFTPTATDPDGDPVTYSLTGDDADLFNIDPTTGEVTPIAPLDFETPTDANGDGIYDITVVATDPDGLTDEEPVAITVDDVNEAPVLEDIGPQTAPENSTDPVFTATDPDGDQPVYSLTGPDADLFNIDTTTGVVTPIAPLDFETPTDANGDGIYDITVVATDPDGLTDEEPVAITVVDVNEAPDAIDDREVTDFNTPVAIDVLDNDSDAEGDTLTIINPTVPANQGTVSVVNGELLFTPADGFEGDATISYTVSDGDLTDTAEVVVTVGDNPADGVVDGAEDGEVMDPGYIDPQGDEIDGADGLDDTINGNGGDDDIDAGLGDDTVSGGEGDDTIDGNDVDDTIGGNEGEDTIDGGDGDDVINGGDNYDTIIGGDGNDTVNGGDGDDIIDTSNPNADANPDVGYPEQDSATIPGLTFPGYPTDDDPDDDKDIVFGGLGKDTITTGDDDTVDGGDGDDTINAGFDDDTVDGGAGNDFIEGGEGNDLIDGGDGNDIIYGGLEDPLADAVSFPDDEPDGFGFQDLVPENNVDTMFGGAGNDIIYGQDDDDSLFGGDGDDALYGGVDDDTIQGDAGDDLIVGGQGADNMQGGLGSDEFIIDEEGDGAGDVIVGGEDPDDNDNDVLDLTGSGVISIAYTDDDPETESGVVTFADGGTLTFSEIETVIPCFTPGTFIATAKVERLVEELQPGDRIITRDNGFQEMAWIGAKQMSGRELVQRPNLKPVFVKAGSLGHGLPEQDMMLSPNHKVLVASEKAELYFEDIEVLVAAKHLIGKPGIQQVDVTQTTYIHFMFERHEVVLSDGAWTESFHPGDYSINGIDEDARNEILALFPELATDQGLRDYRLARTELKKHEARLLIG